MKLKFGKYIFNDWYYWEDRNIWVRRMPQFYDMYIMIQHHGHENVCEMQLGYGLDFISKVLEENLLKDGTILGTVDEVKEKIDALLLKLDRLASFV